MIKTMLVYGDAHAPYHDPGACRIVTNVIFDLKPDVIVNLGDSCDCESISEWNINKFRKRETKRLVKELDTALWLDESMVQNAPTHCLKVKLTGNHENWIERYIDRHPELEGLIELDLNARYESEGWQVIPHGGFFKYGKLLFHHGDRKGYMSKYHASRWAQVGRSIVYGHYHDAQRFSHEGIDANGRHTIHASFSVGCLCKEELEYMENRRRNWNQGFAIIYFKPNGFFNFYHVDIINGGCVVNGRFYSK
jgi:hypothetical protein